MIPMLPRVFPKPSVRVDRISDFPRPPTNPMIIPASSKLKKGCTLNLEAATTIKMTTMTRAMRTTITSIRFQMFQTVGKLLSHILNIGSTIHHGIFKGGGTGHDRIGVVDFEILSCV